jgi:hypothetical protein
MNFGRFWQILAGFGLIYADLLTRNFYAHCLSVKNPYRKLLTSGRIYNTSFLHNLGIGQITLSVVLSKAGKAYRNKHSSFLGPFVEKKGLVYGPRPAIIPKLTMLTGKQSSLFNQSINKIYH